MPCNYYSTLGVTGNASTSEIKKAYKALALIWHPDKNPDNCKLANRKFKEISDAYGVLSDDEKRKVYNRQYRTNDVNNHQTLKQWIWNQNYQPYCQRRNEFA